MQEQRRRAEQQQQKRGLGEPELGGIGLGDGMGQALWIGETTNWGHPRTGDGSRNRQGSLKYLGSGELKLQAAALGRRGEARRGKRR
ncbi:uncharacterized protein ColSpa_08516 [Colletotrichum spaethianum]|uniref:Uncharacterized protein n=1 Tax=Colletotrichum spaethianum TaxID=700344 RepID=A0AA37P9V9_9PEZI|nr:uncharacterized protein ColSpa_08516 [Colletotrichum spaethianum]GKT48335.1 hypothetical protein ColSpa_08516 [Colletotrichum spaethianum]